MNLFTIGFTKKTAREFFTKLEKASVKRIVDIRLNNSSQLAGFAKKDDLEFFLMKIRKIDYVHRVELSPTKDILDGFKKKKIDWTEYEKRFIDLMDERGIAALMAGDIKDGDCLLCSESQPDNCHRRLVAEYLSSALYDIRIIHL